MPEVKLKKFGSGKISLIAFPGWIHPIESENSFLDLLSQKYSVYSVHLPGYMSLPDLREYNNFESLAGKIHEQLDAIDGEKVLVGFSMGCRLIMTLEKHHPTHFKKIFVGSPVFDFTLPVWTKMLYFNSSLLALLRSADNFKLLVVNRAIRAVANNEHEAFEERNVSLTGAFDSLLGLLESEARFQDFFGSTLLIYGENDPYLNDGLKLDDVAVMIIKRAGHNCVRNNEKRVVGIFDSYLRG